MLYFIKNLRIIVLLACMSCFAGLKATGTGTGTGSDKLINLEAEVLKYIGSNDRKAFFQASEKLKAASKEEGDDRTFFRAWGNQAIYEATHQYYESALDIVGQMLDNAREEGSIYGEYEAMHAKAMVLLQQQEYAPSQKAFLEAIEFHRRHFPNESAAEDLRELMKLAYYQGDVEMAKYYGNQLLAEPNLSPHHKGRALYRLATMAFDENNVEEYNRVYDEMNRLSQINGIKSINLFTEVNYHIINKDFKQALLLVDRLAPDTCAERKAIIYHRLGDNEKAYKYMVLYKHISDSLERVSRAREVGSLYLRMNNDRLRLERELLTHQNSQLRNRYYFAVGTFLILILLYIIYKRHRIIQLLRNDNRTLEYNKKNAERSLKELNELSLYESKADLPLTIPVKVNKLCDHLATLTQNHCKSKVITVFQSEFSDDFEITTNSNALEKLLYLLLNDASSFTRKGFINLKCTENGRNVRFSVTDTGEALNENRYVNIDFNICQSISRLLHGRIWHDSEYHDGTRFIFEIPKTVTA